MAEYKEILKLVHHQAKLAGACDKFNGSETLPELIKLFMSPQGVEFCISRHFPNMATIRMFAQMADLTRYGIYIDAGEIALTNPRYVILIGKTSATVTIGTNDVLHKVVAMHGAKCICNCHGWSVTKTECGQGSIIVKNCTEHAYIS